MASRIVVFPVLGRRWAFSAVLPTAGAQGGSPPVLSFRERILSLRELLTKVRATPSTSEKFEVVTNYGSETMHQQWLTLGAAPEKSIRKRIHLIGERLLSRLGPTESFLKAIPKDAEKVEILYPTSSINPRLVRRRVRHLASSGEVIHRRYMYGSVALLPFSLLFGLLPFPNIVFGWNLFRAYSHWRALQGSTRLHYLVTDSPNKMPASPENEVNPEVNGSTITHSRISEEIRKDVAQHWTFLPSEILENLLLPTNVPREAISDITVEEICKQYPVDPQEILKWRDNRLPIKSFG